jgi:hypothetical protein
VAIDSDKGVSSFASWALTHLPIDIFTDASLAEKFAQLELETRNLKPETRNAFSWLSHLSLI